MGLILPFFMSEVGTHIDKEKNDQSDLIGTYHGIRVAR